MSIYVPASTPVPLYRIANAMGTGVHFNRLPVEKAIALARAGCNVRQVAKFP